MAQSTQNATSEAAIQAAEVLLRLNRAVQRATIYPEGHPSIPAAVGPLAAALRDALGSEPALDLGVTAEALLSGGEPVPDKQGSLSWLRQHLRERGLAAIRLPRDAAEEDLTGFVLWLGQAPQAGAAPPRFGGIVLTPVDYSHARFGDRPSEGDEDEVEAVRVWRNLVGGLTAGWYQGEAEGEGDGLPEDPAALAAALSGGIARQEGVGAAAVVSRLVAAGTRLGNLPEPVRRAVKRRLATFVAGLSAELRSQLLRVDPRSSGQKIEFLAEMTDALPDTALMEILADLDLSGGQAPRQTLALMSKLVGISAQEAFLKELTETKLESLGLPRGLTSMDPERVRGALEEVFTARGPTAPNPEAYQARLEELSDAPLPRRPPRRWRSFGDPSEAREIAAHVSDIALRLLVTLPDHPDAPVYLQRVLAEAKIALGEGRVASLYETATAIRDLARLRAYLPEEVTARADEYLSLFATEPAVGPLLDAIEAVEGPTPPELAELFALAGDAGLVAVIERVAARGDGGACDRLTLLLLGAEPEQFAAAAAAVRGKGGAGVAGLLHVMRQAGSPHRADLAVSFLGHSDPAVRREALDAVLAADTRPGQAEQQVERALADEDPSVVGFALEAAGRRGLVSVLRGFLLASPRRRGFELLRRRALEALARNGNPEGQQVLAGLLRERGRRLWPSDLRLSLAIARALRRAGAEPEAVAAWHRSPAGWLARLLGPGAEGRR